MILFPNRPFEDAGGFAAAYFERFARALASVDLGDMRRAGELLLERVDARRAVFACGNGGSAAIANHLACDLLKGARNRSRVRPRVHSLSANVELLTALVNDMEPREAFAYQLESLADPADLLIVVSSSGASPNIVRALQAAKAMGLATLAMTGFGGGEARRLADVALHVDSDNYGVVEDAHQALMHVLAQYVRHARLEPEARLGELPF